MHEDYNPKLEDAVRRTVEAMHADGLSFVKATHIKKRLPDAHAGDSTTQIGLMLAALEDTGILERWSPGHAGATWKITLSDSDEAPR